MNERDYIKARNAAFIEIACDALNQVQQIHDDEQRINWDSFLHHKQALYQIFLVVLSDISIEE